jgi:hypothetical protein
VACGSNRFVGRGVDSSPNGPSFSALVQAPHTSRNWIGPPSDSGRLHFSGYRVYQDLRATTSFLLRGG